MNNNKLKKLFDNSLRRVSACSNFDIEKLKISEGLI